MKRYPRDLHGYGATPPTVRWPEDAAVAVQFVVNYEEGGENCILHGDTASEAFLSEIVGAEAWPDQRHWNMESIYEYGARSGFWRLHRLFTEAGIPVTVFGVANALKRSPTQVEAMLTEDWEIASHGLKWIDYRNHSRDAERSDMEEAISIHATVTGQPPCGWYTGRCSSNTIDLATELGVFDYVADSYADDLPYWHQHAGRNQLIVPYTLDVNDMRFATAQGFNSGDQFFSYLRDSYDVLHAEGKAGRPAMMSVGLHCRLAGRPGRLLAIRRFIDYAKSKGDTWFARRIDIARHWMEHHPAKPIRPQPTTMNREEFVGRLGGVFEHSAWIAERVFEDELGPAHNTPVGLFGAFAHKFRQASENERLGVLKAHPDLAGKLAVAKRLTEDSTKEQAAAGLDALTDTERSRFTDLNATYTEKFGFPFIIAVRNLNKGQILQAFESRIANERTEEFNTACRQVERIARLRIYDFFAEEGIKQNGSSVATQLEFASK